MNAGLEPVEMWPQPLDQRFGGMDNQPRRLAHIVDTVTHKSFNFRHRLLRYQSRREFVADKTGELNEFPIETMQGVSLLAD